MRALTADSVPVLEECWRPKHVELPVAERRRHRVQIVHCHPRPVLGDVAAVRLRSTGAALVASKRSRNAFSALDWKPCANHSSVAASPGPPVR